MRYWRLETGLLMRDRAAAIVLLGWIFLLAYAGVNGWNAVQTLRTDQAQFLATATLERGAVRERIAAIEAGAAEADPYVGFPSFLQSPVAMPITGLAALDTGLLDRMNQNLLVSLFKGPQQAAKGRELQSPLLLANGRFDLGFVAIILMPLALLALLFAQPGDDRAEGRLPLLANQSSLPKTYWRRHALRLLAVLLPLAVISFITALASGGQFAGWLLWIAPLVGWAILWSGACALVGSRSASAATAIAWLVTLWVGLLWLLPAAIDSFASRYAPTPSALSLLSAQRVTEQLAKRQRDALFGNYVSDHPELVVETEKGALAWTRSYFVQQHFIAEAMAEPEAAAQAKRAAHSRLRDRLVWLSPAQALTRASERIAGTDLASSAVFAAAAQAHKQVWDQALIEPLMAGKSLTAADLDRLPTFVPPSPELRRSPVLVLLLVEGLIGIALWRLARWRLLPVD